MKARRQRQDLRVFAKGREPEADFPLLPGDPSSPGTGGLTTPRRIVKSLKAPPTCVTQLVQLDNGQPLPARRFSIGMSVPSECSVSEVRSELCSGALDEQVDVSISSFFDHRRQRQGSRKSSSRRIDVPKAKSAPARGRAGGRSSRHTGARGAARASAAASRGGRDVEDSTILSYSDSGSFYSCDSLDTSSASHSVRSGSRESCRSVSYTAISESVPSCSLTIMGDPVTRVPATTSWGSRARRNQPVPRKQSGSFGSIFGGGIDPYNGTSVTSYPARPHGGRGASASATLSGAVRGASGGGDGGAGQGSPPGQPADPPPTCPSSTTGEQAGERKGARKPSGSPTSVQGTASPADHLELPQDESSACTTPRARESAAHQACGSTQKPVTVPATSSSSAAEGGTAVEATDLSADAGTPTHEEDGVARGPVWRVQNARREERVGRGSYGDVYRGVDLETGRTIAIKEILVPKDFTKDLEKQLQALEREMRVMRKLHHRNTINYLGAVRDENSLNIYMEFVAGGTVGELLREEGALSEERTRGYTRQLLCGLGYLHKRQIVHRDLKGDNLFISENDVLKVGDFGTSKELVTTLVTDSVAGTPNFMAPEVIACSGHSYAADIWSVGCCVLEMLTGMPPFAKLDNHMAVMFAVMKGRLEEQVPDHISAGAKDFIKMCTRNDPKDRWSVPQLRAHPWLTGEDGGAAAAATPAKAGCSSSSDNSTPNTGRVATAAASTTTAAPRASVTEVVLPPESPARGGAAASGSRPPRVKSSAKSAQRGERAALTSPRVGAGRKRGSSGNTHLGSRTNPPTPPLPPPPPPALTPTISTTTPAGGDSVMPPLSSPMAGHRYRTAVPLEPAALARPGAGAGGLGSTPLLPPAAKSPLPTRSDDGDVGGGTTSSDPSSSGNSPGCRTKAGRSGRKATVGAAAATAAVAVVGDLVAPPIRLVPPALLSGAGHGSPRCGSGRPPAPASGGRRGGHGSSSRRHSSPSHGDGSGSAGVGGGGARGSLVPHRPTPREADSAPNRRRRSDEDSPAQSPNGAGLGNSVCSSRVVATPPAGSPTGNPRRRWASGSASGKTSSQSPPKTKKPKARLSS